MLIIQRLLGKVKRILVGVIEKTKRLIIRFLLQDRVIYARKGGEEGVLSNSTNLGGKKITVEEACVRLKSKKTYLTISFLVIEPQVRVLGRTQYSELQKYPDMMRFLIVIFCNRFQDRSGSKLGLFSTQQRP